MTRFAFVLFLCSCATTTRPWTQDLPGQRYGYVRPPPAPESAYVSRPLPQAAPDPRPRMTADEAARALRAREDARWYAHKQEEKDAKAAEEREAQAKLADEIKTARTSGWCKASASDDTCLAASRLEQKIVAACETVQNIHEGMAQVKYLHAEGKRFGVIDLREVDRQKSYVESEEDSLRDLKVEIKAERGRAFSEKECRGRV